MSGTPWFQAYKPAASARTHILAAAFMWTVVGTLLVYFGVTWSLRLHSRSLFMFLLIAVALGILKSRFVLTRTAKRAVGRIRTRGDGHCLGGFLSWKSWCLVAFMVCAGRLLRAEMPIAIVGLIYVGVGTALFVTSVQFWAAWRRREN